MGKYFKVPALRFGCYFGGIAVEQNLSELRNEETKPHIVIATPGRLIDLYQRGAMKFDTVIIC
jgi:superfamily II DNA/RNA helicase